MSMNYKKTLRREYTYVDKSCKNHDYSLKYVLEITNDNIHASCNYYGKKEYYNVLKCSKCNSFIPDTSNGHYDGNIFHIEDIDKTLPVIKAKTKRKNPAYDFYDLYDVEIVKGD